METIKHNSISKREIDELRNLALHNKSAVMYKKVRLDVDDSEYEFQIKGVGKKAIKLELYLGYERILSDKDGGVLEKLLWDKLNTVYHKEPKQMMGKQ